MTIEYNEDEAVQLAKQIGDVFSALYNELRTHEVPYLGQSFDILDFNLHDLDLDLAEHKIHLTQTPLQHHQIWIGDGAKAYAVSEQLPDGTRRIIKTSISVIAERMQQAITRLFDDHVEAEWTVQLLTISAIKTYAFLLTNRHENTIQKLYLFSVPDRFQGLDYPAYIDPASKFLDLLADALTPFAPFTDEETVYW